MHSTEWNGTKQSHALLQYQSSSRATEINQIPKKKLHSDKKEEKNIELLPALHGTRGEESKP
jgi:hypothetical protein